jgi:hypothetical protein
MSLIYGRHTTTCNSTRIVAQRSNATHSAASQPDGPSALRCCSRSATTHLRIIGLGCFPQQRTALCMSRRLSAPGSENYNSLASSCICTTDYQVAEKWNASGRNLNLLPPKMSQWIFPPHLPNLNISTVDINCRCVDESQLHLHLAKLAVTLACN